MKDGIYLEINKSPYRIASTKALFLGKNNLLMLKPIKMNKIFISIPKNLFSVAVVIMASMFFSVQGFSRNVHSDKNSLSIDSASKFQPDTQRNVIEIKNNNGMHGIVRMYLESGKRMAETILYAGTNDIDITSLPNGSYFICLTMDGGATYSQKFTKQ